MVVIIADIITLMSYSLFFLVLRENRYASRIIEVEQKQKVISSGPYVVVRHLMYLGLPLMYLIVPLVSGNSQIGGKRCGKNKIKGIRSPGC